MVSLFSKGQAVNGLLSQVQLSIFVRSLFKEISVESSGLLVVLWLHIERAYV
jgi:hypothetical protein